MSNIFGEEVFLFDKHLEDNHAVISKPEEDEVAVCKRLSQMRSNYFQKEPFDYSCVKPMFLSELSYLGPVAQKYFREEIPGISIKRISELSNSYAEIIKCGKEIRMYVTSKPFDKIDFIAACHEFGHIPSFKNPVRHGYELFYYMEVLPMYLEYLGCLVSSDDKDKAKEYLILHRLNDLKGEAYLYLHFYRMICGDHSYEDMAYETRIRDYYKYIKSFEFLLQLIERAEEDPKLVNSLLDKVVTGKKAIKDLRRPLEINTSGCPKILSLIPKK